MGSCACPKPTKLTAIPKTDCPTDIGQIQKFIFQRGGYQFNAAGTPTPSDITKKADWALLVAATGDTHVVATPLIGGDPIITPGAAITNGGGDNSTLNGQAELTGKNPSDFTGVFKSLSSATKKAIQALSCELDLVVYLVNNNDKIIASEVADGVYEGFPVSSVFLSDRGNNGFGTKDVFNFQFSLKPDYDDNLAIISPESGFSPLRDIA